jgi:small subunit ribosomal protein S5
MLFTFKQRFIEIFKANLSTEFIKKEPKQQLLQRVLHIRRVARVNSGGKIRSTSAMVVVGNMNGKAGFGLGRGQDSGSAILKAVEQAKKNMIEIPRLENRTIYSNIDYKFHKVQLKFYNAKPGIFYYNLFRSRSCCQ